MFKYRGLRSILLPGLRNKLQKSTLWKMNEWMDGWMVFSSGNMKLNLGSFLKKKKKTPKKKTHFYLLS